MTEAYKQTIRETFDEYGAARGFDENVANICKLYRDGQISDDEYKELRKYNLTYYHELPLDA